MTELELMNAVELHHFWDDEINALADRAEKLVKKFNSTPANDNEAKNKLIITANINTYKNLSKVTLCYFAKVFCILEFMFAVIISFSES